MGRNGDSSVWPVRVKRRMSKFARDSARTIARRRSSKCRARRHLPSCPDLRAAPFKMLVQDDRPARTRCGRVRIRRWRARQGRRHQPIPRRRPVDTGRLGQTEPIASTTSSPTTDQATTPSPAPSSGSRWKAATTIRTTSRNPRRHRDCAPGNAPSERSERVGAPVEDSPAATTQWSDGPRRRSRLERKMPRYPNEMVPHRAGQRSVPHGDAASAAVTARSNARSRGVIRAGGDSGRSAPRPRLERRTIGRRCVVDQHTFPEHRPARNPE